MIDTDDDSVDEEIEEEKRVQKIVNIRSVNEKDF